MAQNAFSPDLEKRTAEFFAAITRRDWEDVIERIHPEARAIQNFVGQEVNARQLLQSMRALVESLGGFVYENPRRIVGRDAVVEQHDVRDDRVDEAPVVRDHDEDLVVRAVRGVLQEPLEPGARLHVQVVPGVPHHTHTWEKGQ